jgi:hypothetical protein
MGHHEPAATDRPDRRRRLPAAPRMPPSSDPSSVLDQPLPVLSANVGRVDNGQLSTREPLFDQVVQGVECIASAGLIVLIVADESAKEVRRERLGGEKAPACVTYSIAFTRGYPSPRDRRRP